MEPTFTLKSTVERWKGKAAWHFMTISIEISEQIKAFNEMPRRGFGAVAVEAKIGNTAWKTSIFPEKKGTYVLPVKSDVRKKEQISSGDKVEVMITLQ
ncbi:DUF1905 domain-containing protein [Candidatus Peregrinibacteria bacterium]|jgi:hypothetical protein|nr:DUF1905 domain-containing protein [Candidatus Peregrinibacteria bacterium]MBT7737008.1 DUF1905 domain-containing protein [Candidatus Peregrinibacteria bacterium]